MTATAAPAAGPTSAPAAPANGATSAASAPKNGAESTPQAPAPGAQSAAKPHPPPRYKGKYRDGDKEVEYDLSPEEFAREVQRARHRERMHKDFESQRQEHESRLKRLQEDPDGFLEEAGFDVEGYLARRAERAEKLKALTPEQQEVMKLRDELAKRDALDKRRTQEAETQRQQAEHQALVQRNVQTLGQAMKLSGQKPSGDLLRLYAEAQEMAVRAGEPELTPEQIVAAGERLEVKRLSKLTQRAVSDEAWRTRNAPLLSELAKAVLPQLQGKALLDFVGPQMVKNILVAQLEASRSSPAPIIQEPPPVAPVQNSPSQNTKPVTMWDIEDRLAMR